MSEAPSAGPRLGVSVALWKDDALLLVKRGRPPYAGQWSLPGGRVEFGERLRAAAERELREETAVAAEIGDPLDTFEIILDEDGARPAEHFILIVFTGRFIAGTAAAGDDAAAVAWATAEGVRAFDLTPQTRSIVERRWPR